MKFIILQILLIFGTLNLQATEITKEAKSDILKVNAGVEYDFQGGYNDRVANVDVEYMKNYESSFTYGASLGFLRMSNFTTPLDEQGKRYVIEGFNTLYACLRNGVSVRPVSAVYLELLTGPCYFQKAETLISGNLQFNTQVGLGFRDPRTGSTIGVHVRHFSNAGLKKPNDGINLYMISMGISFD
jgi:hypothetical protein